MDTLLMAAIVVTALAVVVQAGVLVAMYLMSRQVADRVNGLVRQTQRLMAPIENVTQNLKSASTDLADMGKTARAQVEHVNEIVGDVRQAVDRLTGDVRQQVTQGISDVQTTVMRPVREWSAIAIGITEGVRVFFGATPRTRRVPVVREDTAA
jgi:hypothetical protein